VNCWLVCWVSPPSLLLPSGCVTIVLRVALRFCVGPRPPPLPLSISFWRLRTQFAAKYHCVPRSSFYAAGVSCVSVDVQEPQAHDPLVLLLKTTAHDVTAAPNSKRTKNCKNEHCLSLHTTRPPWGIVADFC